MTRLFLKLFFALWLSIMGFAIVMAVVNNFLVQSSVNAEQTGSRLDNELQKLGDRLTRALQEEGPGSVERILAKQPGQIRNRIFLFNRDGEELGGRPGVAERMRSRMRQANTRRVTDSNGTSYRLVTLTRSPRGALLEPGRRGNNWRLLLAALVSALVSFVIARYLARPLVKLGGASQRLAAGDLATRIGKPLTGRKDEFGGLARDFDEMAARLDELQRANRRLLRDVSHELRSPLARLRVALEIARNRDSQAVSGELDRIELESERLETLVDEVLGLLRESSETNPLKKEDFDLVELLHDLEEVVRYEMPDQEKGLKLSTHGPLPVSADRELLWRALENLIRNALVHTAAGTGIEVEAIHSAERSEIDVFVRDSGPGVPPQHLLDIFKPFYRVQEARDRHSGGHGLGLAIAEAAIRRHGGSISARNRESGGLEIQVCLPV